MSPRYIGFVADPIAKNGKYGFVDRKTIRRLDEQPMDFAFTKDVFIPQKDCPDPLRPQMELEFEIAEDEKRGDGYRAVDACETPPGRLQRLADGGIKLYVKNRILENPLTFVSWQFSSELLEWARTKRVEQQWPVQLLLIWWPLAKDAPDEYGWRHRTHEEKRLLVDLSKPIPPKMAAIPFRSSGTYRLVAALVSAPAVGYLRRVEAGDYYLHDHRYGNSFPWTKEVQEREHIFITGSGYLDLEVPKELFAKKPLDYAWVNKGKRNGTKDSCETNERRPYAYLIQPLLVVLAYLAMAGTVFWYWLWGFFKLDYACFKQPLESWAEIRSHGGNVFLWRVRGRRFILPLLASPAIWLMVALLASIKTAVVTSGVALWGWTHFGHVSVIAVMGIVFLTGVVWGISAPIDEAEKLRLLEEEKKWERSLREEQIKRLETSLPELDPRALPLTRQTIPLYVAYAKQRLCSFYEQL